MTTFVKMYIAMICGIILGALIVADRPQPLLCWILFSAVFLSFVEHWPGPEKK